MKKVHKKGSSSGASDTACTTLEQKNSELVGYIRAKTDRLLQVIGTIPLRQEELDDDTLLTVDPIGIVSEAFEQVLEHLHQLNQVLTSTRDELQAVFDSAAAGIVVVNTDMEVTSFNRYSQQHLFGGEEKVTGRNLRTLLCVDEDECILDRILATGSLVEQNSFQFNGRFYHLMGTPIKSPGGAITHMVLFYTDITERLVAAKEIERLAFYDSLTGLPNRVLLQDRLSQMLSRATRNTDLVAVLFIDLDRFKEVNDTLGHSSGDKMLQMVASRLSATLRGCDTVARLGGDEFVVLLEGIADRQHIREVASKLLNSLSRGFLLDQREIYTGASMGIAIYPHDGTTVEHLFQNADIAMYNAKENGRNRFSFYADEMHASALEQINIRNSLRSALQRDEFHLLYQPQVNLADGRLVGAEILLRWHHPELGVLLPELFLKQAEESGKIVEIGAWMLERGCSQLAEWLRKGLPPIRIAINLSLRQFRDPSLADLVESAIQKAGIPPNLLELEFNEGMLTGLLEDIRKTLQTLKSLGISLAIDDFGTGYSSISYLRHFPLNRMKVDKAFVQDIAENAGDASTVIMDAVIALAHSLNLTVVAERIENVDHALLLKQRRCDELQGYCCSPPLSPEAFEQLLNRTLNPDYSLLKI